MWTNATITLKRPGVGYDEETGNRTDGEETTILDAVPCVFSQDGSVSRQLWANGIQEGSKPVFGVLIPGRESAAIAVGDIAVITYLEKEEAYKVGKAVLTPGIAENHWELTVEAYQAALPPEEDEEEEP